MIVFPCPAFAGPYGYTVVGGQANISQSGSTTSINQSTSKAIINWQSFSIGADETINFNQPSASSVALNRVTGNERSVISGALNANGQVFLVNSAGILFTRGAQFNVGGLVASTLDISNDNFMKGNYAFEGSSTASVINRGHIHARTGGYVALLGNTVSNEGTITATLGTVAMASGNMVSLNFNGNSLVDVTISQGAYKALVSNKGLIKADGGRVILTAKSADAILSAQVNNSGIIQARTMSALMGGHGGGYGYRSHGRVHVGPVRVAGHKRHAATQVASHKRSPALGSTSRTGSILLLADGGTTTVSGTLDASAPKGGDGGTIVVTGNTVALTGTANLNASGTTGGLILIGGDVHGGSIPSDNFLSTAVMDATATTIAPGATLNANGSNGNGGDIVVWSNEYTSFNGAISATGAGAGNGGFAEVSSHDVLGFTGTVDLTSAHGTTGTLLLDPYTIYIADSSDAYTAPTQNGSNETFAGTLGPAGDLKVISTTTLEAALATANVTVTTSGGSGITGDIDVAGSITWSSGHSLTLTAQNNINIYQSIASTGTGGTLTLNAGYDIDIEAPLALGRTTLVTTAVDNINVTAPISWSFTSTPLTLTATNNVNLDAALTPTGTGQAVSLQATKGSVTIATPLALGSAATLTAQAGTNINVNAPISWSANTLTLKASANIYVNDVMTATNTASLNAAYGTGTNADGTPMGLYMAVGSTNAYTGRIDFPSTDTGTVTLNGKPYTVINSKAGLDAVASNLSGYYVLGSSLTGLGTADVAPFGFSPNAIASGHFNGFGQSLTVTLPQSAISPSALSQSTTTGYNINTALAIPAMPNTGLVLASAGDIDINAPVTSSAGLLTFKTTGYIDLYTSITAANANDSVALNASQIYAAPPLTITGTNIFINAPLSWTTKKTLTLNAYNNLYINGSITSTYASATTSPQTPPQLYLNAGNNIYINAPVTMDGPTSNLYLNYGGYASKGSAASGTNYYINTTNGAYVTFGGSTLGINGTDYTLITNLTDLIKDVTANSAGNFAIVNNIDLTGTPAYTPSSGLVPYVNGTIAGLGHTIKGLTINSSGDAALIEVIGSPGLVRDLGLTNVNYQANGSAAGLAIYNGGVGNTYHGGTVYNDYVTGTISSTLYVAGLVNDNEFGGAISYSSVNVTLSTALSGGGLVGTNEGYPSSLTSTIDHSSAIVTANLADGVEGFGGLVGGNGGGTVTNSTANVNISAPDGGTSVSTVIDVGGAFGGNGGTVDSVSVSGTITIYNAGFVNSVNGGVIGAAGGFVSYNTGTITNSSSSVNITVNGIAYAVGGFAGENSGALINDSFTGTITVPRAQYTRGFGGLGEFVGFNGNGGIVIIDTSPPGYPFSGGGPGLQSGNTFGPPNTGNPGSPTGSNGGSGTGFSTGSGTAQSDRSSTSQEAAAAGAAVASGAANGNGSSSTSDPQASASAGTFTTANIDPNITNSIPATTPLPLPSQDRKRRKTVSLMPKPKPRFEGGAFIRTITIDGQEYKIQDESPKNGDAPKTDAPNTATPKEAVPAGNAPAAPAADDKAQ